MTDPKTRLAEIRAAVEQSLSDGAGGDRFPARDLVVLLERIAHLEGLLEQRRFDDLCPWCERVLCAADDEDGGTEHSRACPAFTPEGEIK